MNVSAKRAMMKGLLAGLVGSLLPLTALAAKPDPVPVPPGTPVIITVQPAAAATPTVTITLFDRHGHVTPHRCGCTHTGGGNIDVQQPSPDVVVVTMSGIGVATGTPCKDSSAAMEFLLDQGFEVVLDSKVKKAKISLEGRVIGLLRSECKGGGAAEESPACASVMSPGGALINLDVPPHSVSGGENLSINCHEGPIEMPIAAGKYTLHQSFGIVASHPHSLLPTKAASAEFAADPALDPLWISYWEPFHGAAKKDFGFQITLKVSDDTPVVEEKKPEEKKPEEKKPVSLQTQSLGLNPAQPSANRLQR